MNTVKAVRSPTLADEEELIRAARALAMTCDNRRSSKRRSLTLPAKVMAINALDQPVGETVSQVTVDISTNGIGLLHQQPLRDRIEIYYFQTGRRASPAACGSRTVRARQRLLPDWCSTPPQTTLDGDHSFRALTRHHYS